MIYKKQYKVSNREDAGEGIKLLRENDFTNQGIISISESNNLEGRVDKYHVLDATVVISEIVGYATDVTITAQGEEKISVAKSRLEETTKLKLKEEK